MLGTPAFMAPEQAKGQTKDVDGRTDLWAVGATMFSLISGKLVHEAESATMLLLRAGTTSARSLRSVDEEVPAPIVRVVDKALAFDKPARWADAATMRDALKEACIEALGEPPSRDKLAEFVAALNSAAVRPTSAPPPPKLTDEDVPRRDSTVTTKVEGKGKPAAEAPKPGKLAQTLLLDANVKAVPPPAAKASPSIEAAKEPPAPSPVRTLPLAQKSVLPREPKQDVGLTTSKPVSKEVPVGPAKEAEGAPLAPVAPASAPAQGARSYVPVAVGIVLVVGILVGLAVVMLDGRGGGGQATPPPPAASSLPAPASSASVP